MLIEITDAQLLEESTEEIMVQIRHYLLGVIDTTERMELEGRKNRVTPKTFTEKTKHSFARLISEAYQMSGDSEDWTKEIKELYDLITMEARKIAKTKAIKLIKQFNVKEGNK